MASIPWKLSLTVLGCAALLGGCASVRDVQSDVQSFSALAALPAPPTYRLELLPSQQAQAPQFAAIESQAQQALARVGLRRDDSQASLVVQIGAQARYTRDAASYYGPYGPRWNWGLGFGRGAGWGMGMGFGGFMFDTPPLLHYRAVSVVMREQRTQRIVYETSAVHEDVWTNDPAIFGTLFDAALSGFPNPPPGARQIRTPLAVSGAATPVPAVQPVPIGPVPVRP